MAERYGETPDSALATELFGAERTLFGTALPRPRALVVGGHALTPRTGVSEYQ
jgi:hypothetical protein